MPSSLNEQHAVETYKSLITYGREGLRAVQLLNGGAIVALLAYLGQTTNGHSSRLDVRVALYFFIVGLALGTCAYALAYFTQLRLHNENVGNAMAGQAPHTTWLNFTIAFALSSLLLFVLGALAAVNVLATTEATTATIPHGLIRYVSIFFTTLGTVSLAFSVKVARQYQGDMARVADRLKKENPDLLEVTETEIRAWPFRGGLVCIGVGAFLQLL